MIEPVILKELLCFKLVFSYDNDPALSLRKGVDKISLFRISASGNCHHALLPAKL